MMGKRSELSHEKKRKNEKSAQTAGLIPIPAIEQFVDDRTSEAAAKSAETTAGGGIDVHSRAVLVAKSESGRDGLDKRRGDGHNDRAGHVEVDGSDALPGPATAGVGVG